MIAYAMLYTIAFGVPIAAGAFLGAAFLRRHGRTERAVWGGALVTCLGSPLLALLRGPGAPGGWPAPELETVLPALPPLLVLPGAPAVNATVGLDGLLASLWVVASTMLLARWVVAGVRLSGERRSWWPDTIDGVPLLVTPGPGPAVTGIVRPRIVVPSWVVGLSGPERALVLLHESEHVRARDPWLSAAGRVCRVLTPWNPVVWVLTSRLHRAIELDCDRRVLRRRPDVRAYGATLLLVSARGSDRLLASAAFAESEVPLRRRILAMTTPPSTISVVGLLTALVLGVVLLVGAFQIPVPAVRFSLEIEPGGVAANDAGAATEAPGPMLPVPRVIADPLERIVYLVRMPPDPPVFVSADPRIPIAERVGENLEWQFRAPAQYVGGTFGAVTVEGRLMQVFLPLDDQPPELSRTPRILDPSVVAEAIAAAYPPALRAAGVGGTVGVQLLVGVDGGVEKTRIGQISMYPELDEAALAVAGTYRFLPALDDEGKPIDVWVGHAIAFQPDRSPSGR